MIYISRNKLYALVLYCVVNSVVFIRGVEGQLELSSSVIGVILIPILFPSLVAWLASWGLIESLAKDSKLGLSPDLVSFFYWLLLVIVSMFFLFNWRVY